MLKVSIVTFEFNKCLVRLPTDNFCTTCVWCMCATCSTLNVWQLYLQVQISIPPSKSKQPISSLPFDCQKKYHVARNCTRPNGMVHNSVPKLYQTKEWYMGSKSRYLYRRPCTPPARLHSFIGYGLQSDAIPPAEKGTARVFKLYQTRQNDTRFQNCTRPEGMVRVPKLQVPDQRNGTWFQTVPDQKNWYKVSPCSKETCQPAPCDSKGYTQTAVQQLVEQLFYCTVI